MTSRRSHPRSQRAMTLVEMCVSLAIVSILLLAAQSAFTLTAKGIPDGKSKISSALASSRTMEMICSDLTYATAVSTLGASDVVFTVPDRNNDGSPETIRYVWSGVADAPLQRQYNGGALATVASSVREFSLGYDKKQRTLDQSYSAGSETLLFSYTNLLLNKSGTVEKDKWWAQTITPTLPSNAVSWNITRVRLSMRQNSSGSSGESNLVQIRSTQSGLPNSQVLGQTIVSESSLSSGYSWRDIPIANVPMVPPQTALALAVRPSGSDDKTCDLQYKDALLGLIGSGTMCTSAGNDTSWSTGGDSNLLCYVYGKITTPDAPTTGYFLTNVRVALRCGSDSGARVNTAIRIPNEPQVAGP